MDESVNEIIEIIKKQHPKDYMNINANDCIWNTLNDNYGFDKSLVAALILKLSIGQCAWCKKYHLGTHWQDAPHSTLNHLLKQHHNFTHAPCPSCLIKLKEEIKHDRENK